MTAPPFAHPDTWTPDEHAAARCACGAAVPDAPGCECHGGPPAVCVDCRAVEIVRRHLEAAGFTVSK